MEDNVLTDVETTLKAALEARARLAGQPVPVVVVTPDPDFIELELPCLTMQLADVRRDPVRKDNERRVEKDVAALEAAIRPPTEPYDLGYTVAVHTENLRDERLLLEQVLCLLAEQPALTTVVGGREVYLAPDASFRDTSKERDIIQAVGIVVKARLEPDAAQTVLLALEHHPQVREV